MTTSVGSLTARETDVVRGLADGLTNRVISERLFISPATVKRHVERLLEKLDAGNRAGIVAISMREGLL